VPLRRGEIESQVDLLAFPKPHRPWTSLKEAVTVITPAILAKATKSERQLAIIRHGTAL